jgi:hypothetical protein
MTPNKADAAGRPTHHPNIFRNLAAGLPGR